MLSLPTSAATWQVQPKVCITRDANQTCRLELTILFPPSTSGEFCLYLHQVNQPAQQVKCWLRLPEQETLPISYQASSQLLLKNELAQVVQRAELEVKTLTTRRKRVRAPWSFF
ncbi:DUF3019 domain-containing protein [Thalassotalea euphylliae]|uniref:DUF3019 domain-containing protein n=2 Tax=Thalassotalea euphylliae TaxID=1655234 RepID=A0A3E0TPR2_9GAMM|nr:DUF3019 domain-containing protein [Thalassotalea euphylliae]